MILSFKPEMVKPILKGTKIHSIRRDYKQRWKAGMKIHFATGVRTKKYNQFKFGICYSVQKITMNLKFGFSNIFVDGKRLDPFALNHLGINDGFKNWDGFIKFFGLGKFKGIIIHWTDFRYIDPPTREDLKRIREKLRASAIPNWEDPDGTIRHRSKSDHAYDALRYGRMMHLHPTPKKVGLFGRLIAWIFGK